MEDDRGQLPRNTIFLDCSSVAKRLLIPYAYTPTAIPAFTASIDLICLLIFSTVKYFRYKRRTSDKVTIYRDIVFGILVAASMLDIIISLVDFEKQFIANMLRPVIICLCYRSQMDFFTLVALNIKDSFAMLFCILIWALYFAIFGNFLFEDIMQGIMVFDNLADSYWAMFVCLTTENFPDVMLLATERNIAYSIFFIVFILIGCFFLTSVLLAVIFDNFKNRMEILQKKKVSHRMVYIEQFFDAYDENQMGWLTLEQTKAFFATVCDLDFKKRSSHRRLFRKILKIIDPEENKFVFKERILDFFEISGFQIISKLCQEQM